MQLTVSQAKTMILFRLFNKKIADFSVGKNLKSEIISSLVSSNSPDDFAKPLCFRCHDTAIAA